MQTPAQKLGLEVGKLYTVVGTSDAPGAYFNVTSNVKVGCTVRFVRDCTGPCPYFEVIENGKVTFSHEIINVEHVVLRTVEEVSEKAAESLTYRIESNKDETNVYVRKQLSLDQIKRIMDILGE